MFTDRFIEIPIRVYDVKTKELTGNEINEDQIMKLNPFDISRYYPVNADDNDTDFTCTMVVFKDGESVVCYATFDEFEKILNNAVQK